MSDNHEDLFVQLRAVCECCCFSSLPATELLAAFTTELPCSLLLLKARPGAGVHEQMLRWPGEAYGLGVIKRAFREH